MKNSRISVKIQIIELDVLVIGSGCAGFNAAHCLFNNKVGGEIAIVTEGINMGTSRNSGSDKQTYYKLSLSGERCDSVRTLAQDLFDGMSVHGDLALAEAANSAKCFLKLTELGVPFPTNEYGEYVGYQTDHDSYCRATSCGPLTSKLMTQSLELAVKEAGIKIYDKIQIIKFAVENNKVIGAYGLVKDFTDKHTLNMVYFSTSNIIAATGGPAYVYSDTVYPNSQTGMTGLLLDCGAVAANLQEWQYGLASVKFRWNLSGSYQQVLPRYVAIDKNLNEREFLKEYVKDDKQRSLLVFLKGYQWPFDIAKIDSSSMIDAIVYYETQTLHNRVYLDYTQNPDYMCGGIGTIDETALKYLEKSKAIGNTPIERLQQINPAAIKLYKNHGIDLYTQMLEIKVCPQHNNGGIQVDSNWQSNIDGLYVCGEAAGTFGAYRPGGAALNSTQVGSMRAARHISFNRRTRPCIPSQRVIKAFASMVEQSVDGNTSFSVSERKKYFTESFTQYGAHIRNCSALAILDSEARLLQKDFFKAAQAKTAQQVPELFKLYEIIITQRAIISAMHAASRNIGSRAGAMYVKTQDSSAIPEYIKRNKCFPNSVLCTSITNEEFVTQLEPTRPIPYADTWFESVWRTFNET